jgi:hypothetical protein
MLPWCTPKRPNLPLRFVTARAFPTLSLGEPQGKLTFSGKTADKEYAFDLDLFKGLNVEESKWTNTGRQVQVRRKEPTTTLWLSHRGSLVSDSAREEGG